MLRDLVVNKNNDKVAISNYGLFNNNAVRICKKNLQEGNPRDNIFLTICSFITFNTFLNYNIVINDIAIFIDACV